MKLPTVKDLQIKIAEAESAKASAAAHALSAEEAEKKALIEKLTRPSGLSDEEASKRAEIIINRAVEAGRTSVQVLRFPHSLATDGGRAINQAEEGWEKTLTGIPREMYGFWERQLKPLGYHLRCEIIDYPGGMPGDIGLTLSWG